MDFLTDMFGGGTDSDAGPARDDFFANMSAQDKARYEEAAVGLSAQQLQRLQNIFDRHDVDKSGEIDVHELRSAMAELGTNLSLGEASKLISLMDESGDGLIQFWEFVEFFKPGIQEKGGNVTDMVTETLKQNAGMLKDQLADLNNLRDYQDSAQAAHEQVLRIEADIDEIKSSLVGNARTPKVTRMLEELNKELLEAKDRADARKFRVERLKRRIEAEKNPKKINPTRARLYRVVEKDLGLGLQMVSDIHASITVCTSQMDRLRELRKKESKLRDALEVEQLHKEMADLLYEIKERADDIENHFDELETGTQKVRKYWYKQLQTDLLYAKFEKEFEASVDNADAEGGHHD